MGLFTQVEINDIVSIGYLNGLFVLARSIGLIGHALDQKRLGQPLYRHPWCGRGRWWRVSGGGAAAVAGRAWVCRGNPRPPSPSCEDGWHLDPCCRDDVLYTA